LVHVWKSRGCNFAKSKAKPPHAIVRLEPRGGVKREPRGIQKGTKGNQADRQISGNGHWQFIYIYIYIAFSGVHAENSRGCTSRTFNQSNVRAPTHGNTWLVAVLATEALARLDDLEAGLFGSVLTPRNIEMRPFELVVVGEARKVVVRQADGQIERDCLAQVGRGMLIPLFDAHWHRSADVP